MMAELQRAGLPACTAVRRKRGLAPVLAAVVLSVTLATARPQAAHPTQYDVEAVYLFNFGKFVSWPQKNTTGFVICILGENPFGSALDRTISGENIAGRKVEDKRIARETDVAGCSILYISRSEEQHLPRIFSATRGLPLLTVSDIPDFAQRGGMIQFVVDNGKVRFQVNRAPAERSGLALSSELLKVAVRVTNSAGKEGQ